MQIINHTSVRFFFHSNRKIKYLFVRNFFFFFCSNFFSLCLAWNLSRIIYCCTSSSKLWQNNAKEWKKEREKNNKSKSNLSSCEDNEMLQQELNTGKLSFVRQQICSTTKMFDNKNVRQTFCSTTNMFDNQFVDQPVCGTTNMFDNLFVR
jgi:hypothetical protein